MGCMGMTIWPHAMPPCFMDCSVCLLLPHKLHQNQFLCYLCSVVTNQPRGCAFVSYATKTEAELAIQKLDRQLHLPGALCPIEVSAASSCAGRTPGEAGGFREDAFKGGFRYD